MKNILAAAVALLVSATIITEESPLVGWLGAIAMFFLLLYLIWKEIDELIEKKKESSGSHGKGNNQGWAVPHPQSRHEPVPSDRKIHPQSVKSEPAPSDKQINPQSVKPDPSERPKPEPEPEAKILVFPVKGVFAHEDEIFHGLMMYNEEYDMTKSQLVKEYGYEATIYKWIPKTTDIKLVPEPNNQYDPNAIKIVVGNVTLGYVPAEQCLTILQALEEGRIITTVCTITGGLFKRLVETSYDSIKDSSIFELESGYEKLGAEIILKIKE